MSRELSHSAYVVSMNYHPEEKNQFFMTVKT